MASLCSTFELIRVEPHVEVALVDDVDLRSELFAFELITELEAADERNQQVSEASELARSTSSVSQPCFRKHGPRGDARCRPATRERPAFGIRAN